MADQGRSGVSPSMAIPVENDELYTVRDAMRELNRIVDGLRGGVDPRKAALMKNNKMVAVVVSVDEYRNLLASRWYLEPVGEEGQQ